jgi:hypothetical protein
MHTNSYTGPRLQVQVLYLGLKLLMRRRLLSQIGLVQVLRCCWVRCSHLSPREKWQLKKKLSRYFGQRRQIIHLFHWAILLPEEVLGIKSDRKNMADFCAIWRHFHDNWFLQLMELPLTRLNSEPATIFTPRVLAQIFFFFFLTLLQ